MPTQSQYIAPFTGALYLSKTEANSKGSGLAIAANVHAYSVTGTFSADEQLALNKLNSK